MPEKINLHSHTQYCDGQSSMEEIIRAASSAGFTEWGFSPHAPICVESPCNMKEEDVQAYLAEIERLRSLYPQIKIWAGMEVDYIDDENGPASQNIKNYNLDYVIGSVHFIPDQEGSYHDIDGSSERFKRHLAEFFHNDLDYVVKTFWRQTASMLKAGGLDIVGHIDKIALNASSVNPEIEKNPYYKKLAEETINLAIDQGIKIEINTKHWEKSGRMFPHPRYWSQIKAAGGELIINSDAHSVDMIETGMEAAKNLLNMTDYA